MICTHDLYFLMVDDVWKKMLDCCSLVRSLVNIFNHTERGTYINFKYLIFKLSTYKGWECRILLCEWSQNGYIVKKL